MTSSDTVGANAPAIELSALAPSLALAVMQTGSAVSLAALVFIGEASSGLGAAATTFLLGSLIASLVCVVMGGFSVIVAGARNNVTVVLASVAAAVLASARGAASDSMAVDTVVAFVMVATISSGLLLYLVGRFGLGNLVRFLPFPVMGGYLAGTGLLMLKGGLSVMANRSVRLGDLGDLITWDIAQFWIPGVVLALAIVLLPGANKQSLVLAAAIAGFHLLLVARSGHDRAEADGWVLGPLPANESFTSALPTVSEVDWGAIWSNAAGIAAVALIALIGVLLNTTGVGYSLGEEVDINRELRAAGAASVASGAVGGTIGFVGIGPTLLAHRLRASSLLVVAMFAALAIATIVAGPAIVGWMPRFVAGSLIMSPGFLLLDRWFKQSVLTGSIGDRAVAFVIPLTIAFVGVIEGVAVGIAAAVAVFVVRYASVEPVRSHLSGVSRRSAIERPPEEQAILDVHGGEIAIIEVVGFLFFGSASKLTDQVRTAIAGGISQCILDFRRVTGLDSSAEAELGKLIGVCHTSGVTCSFAELAEPVQARLVSSDGQAAVVFHPDLDHALEIAEKAVLIRHESASISHAEAAQRRTLIINNHFRPYLVPAGTDLISTGGVSDAMYFVQSGSCTVWDGEDDTRRIRRVLPGAFVGEMGFFSDERRSARVTADGDVSVLRLTRREFDALVDTDPAAAIRLMREVLALSSARLNIANSTIRDLLR